MQGQHELKEVQEEAQGEMKRCGQHGDGEKRDLLPFSSSSALYAPLPTVIDKHTLLLCIMTDYIR